MIPESRRGRRVRRTLAVVALLATLPVAGRLSAQVIEGRVVRSDSFPVVDALVELHRITADSGRVVDSARTGEDGRFRFSVDVAGDPGAVYLASARYSGILYWGEPLHGGGVVPAEGGAPLTVAVFDTTVVSGPAVDLVVGMRHVVLTPGGTGLQVDEIIDIRGRTGRTVVSSSDSVPIWRGALAHNAHGAVSTATEVSRQDILLGGSTIGLLGVLPPTGARLGVSYFTTSHDYVLTLEHRTDRLEVLIVDLPGLEVTASGVQEVQTEDVDTGVSMRRFTGSGLDGGTTIRLDLNVSEPRGPTVWPWLAAGLLLSLAALASRRLAVRRE